MKKLLSSVPLVVVLVLTLALAPGTALAQGPLLYSSAYQIQNLEATQATVHIEYFDQDSSATYAGDVIVPASGSKTIFPFVTGPFGDNITGPATFNGSAVLSSDKQIAAILNTQTGGSTPFYGASTNGFSGGAEELFLPLIACNNTGFDTWFNVQNAGSANATVTIEYIPGAFGTAASDTGVSIGPSQANTFDQRSDSTTGTKRCGAGLGTKFVGSAKVTSTNGQPIVAAVMFLGTGGIKTLQGYNGFVAGSTSVNLPLVMSNNSSYYSSIQVQNAGQNSTTLTVDFGANTQGSGSPASEVFTLGAGEAKTLIQIGGVSAYSPSNDWNAIGKYVGGAAITQTGSEPLVAVVNQNSTKYTSLGTSYEGFNPDDASGTIKLPLIAANNSGYLTGVQIQAVSGSPSVTVDYSTNTGSGPLAEPTNDTKTLSAGETWTLIQAGNDPVLSGSNNWGAAGQYVGSASVTATGGTVIAIVNFNGPATIGDTFYTYDGFNQ
ncbi:MAG: hypothetical protein ISS56_10760 [Anaerolineae bacterium]|nr:hypothetical protein [Anaerolineae bacterium]